MEYQIVFSDIDGTMLDSNHQLRDTTRQAILTLREKGVPFVIVSARNPGSIDTVQRAIGVRVPMVSFSGALIFDENRQVVHTQGFSADTARQVVDYVETHHLDCTWNIYAGDLWLTKSRQAPRVVVEESIVGIQATEGTAADLPADAVVGKVLCMCNPQKAEAIRLELQGAFPELQFCLSTAENLEVMPKGLNKATAVETLCRLWHIPTAKAMAFGDNYNDVEMLQAVGAPFLMANAPEELKAKILSHTESNDEDGIVKALQRCGMV